MLDFKCRKIKFHSSSSNYTGAISKAAEPILGLFVLIWMHIVLAEYIHGLKNIVSKLFEKKREI